MLQMCDVSKIPVSASRHEIYPSAVSAFTNYVVDAMYSGGKEAQYFGESWHTSFIKPASTTPVVRTTILAHEYLGMLFFPAARAGRRSGLRGLYANLPFVVVASSDLTEDGQ